MVADRYNLNKLVDREIRKEYQIEVANRFSALEGLEISSVDDTWVKIIKIKNVLKRRRGECGTYLAIQTADEGCSAG